MDRGILGCTREARGVMIGFMDVAINIPVQKTDESLGLVFGWASVAKENGEILVDTDGDTITEEALLKAASEFATGPALDSHAGESMGAVTVFPLTTDIAKSLGITTEKTGLLCMMKPSPEVFAKYQTGEYTGFSIGGTASE